MSDFGPAAEGGRNFCYFRVSIQGGNAPKARENFGFYALYKRENRPKIAKILARFQITINPPLVSPDFGPKGRLIDLNTPDHLSFSYLLLPVVVYPRTAAGI